MVGAQHAVPLRAPMILQPSQPFSFELACSYLMRSPSTILERVEPGRYRRAVVLDGKQTLVTVEDGLRVTPAAAAPLVRRIFQLDVDVTGLSEVARADPVFAALVKQCRGLRPILLPTPFETLIWAILGQQVNVSFAAKTKRALAERYGERLTAGGETFLLFPTPDELASANNEDLASLQLSRQKARYIKGIADGVLQGRFDLEAIGVLPEEEAIGILRGIVGVGRWTAEYVLLRGFGHKDVIPAADAGLQIAIGRAYGLGRKATEPEVRELAERWAGWRGYAAFYWWAELQWNRK